MQEFHKCKRNKDGLQDSCKICKSIMTKTHMQKEPEKYKQKCRAYRQQKPWIKHYSNAKQRCTNPHKDGFEKYGGSGIKFQLTLAEIESIWFRDKAFLLSQPSLDRIESSKNYAYDNCRFIELKENSGRATRGLKRNGRRGEILK
jgi:hypothetical protein